MLDDLFAEIDKDIANAPQPTQQINQPSMACTMDQPTPMDSVSQLPVTAAEVEDPFQLWDKKYQEQIKYLKTTEIPYLYFNRDNVLCTHNWLGSYKDCRKMSEVALILRQQYDVVGEHKWTFLANEARRDGRFIINWFLKIPVYDIEIGPMSFLPRNRKTVCRTIRIIKNLSRHQLDLATQQMIDKKLNMFHNNPDYHKTKMHETRKIPTKRTVKRLQNQM